MEEKGNKTDKKSGINWIVRNLVGAIAFFAALVVVSIITLNLITNHGKTIEVPDFNGLPVKEAIKEADKAGLRAEVIDSIFVRRMEKGAVFSQNPKAGSSVKKGRRILLTINATQTKKISMPNLVGYSLRQAIAELSARGLSLGKITYVNDIATNNVLQQRYRGRQIKAGAKIESGSDINLVVGLNPEDNRTYIPNVKGMKYLTAVETLHNGSLNVGKLTFKGNIRNYRDSINAVVTSQAPSATGAPAIMGSEVRLTLEIPEEKPEETTE